MAQPDFQGARGSNAGDDFHELWVLRQALILLDQETELKAIAVEGLRAEDEKGLPKDVWEGVDCTFYYGGGDLATAEQIVIDQVKYSAANPNSSWTVSRLTKTTNKAGTNSVIARLAKAFTGLAKMRSDLVESGNLRIRLVSNQPLDPAVPKALSPPTTGSNNSRQTAKDRAALLAATTLTVPEFEAFTKALDLTECGGESRFANEEKILIAISSWTEDDARLDLTHLMRFVRRMMMPEAKGEVIVRESIFAQLGFSDPAGLFPCPSAIRQVDRLVPRAESQVIVDKLVSGTQRLCVHGLGGCGKTTLLQDMAGRLPSGSKIIVYDCYGGGRYLDSDAFRHRPPDAFLQLSNELAQQLRTPLLISKSPGADYPKLFKKRLNRAAEIVASQSSDAILLVVADAADNSITAANSQSPPERSFIHDFVALGDLPPNVRLMVTCRTGRLETLNLPVDFPAPLEIKGFSREETEAHVHSVWSAAPTDWIDDFYYLSDGNPRVERYALEYAGDKPTDALEYLRPHGKSLNNVFQEQLEHARHKLGFVGDIRTYCAGLVTLPRPIPVESLSAVTKLSVGNLQDLCSDLAPGIRLKAGLISFADEDFEHFLRVEGESQIAHVQSQIADYFLNEHKVNSYAATHIASALLSAQRGTELIKLIELEREPSAIGDPVLRKQVQLHRLSAAMKICRDLGSIADAMLTVLIGAEALKTDNAIRQMLINNSDLAASFARDTASRMILRDPTAIETHGPLLFHLLASDAFHGDRVSVREGLRQLRAWLQRRDQDAEQQKRDHPHHEPERWPIEANDIAAQVEAVLRTAGPVEAVKTLKRWKPRALGSSVVLPLVHKLIISGDHELVERCTQGAVPKPWDLFLLTLLGLAGRPVELWRLEASLKILLRRKLIRIDMLQQTWREDQHIREYLEIILTSCEIVVFRGGDVGIVSSVLERIAEPSVRQQERLNTSQTGLIDLTLRAHSLLERLNGRKLTLDTYLVSPPPISPDLPEREKARIEKERNEKRTELDAFIGHFVELYDVRAQLLVGATQIELGQTALINAASRSRGEDYRLRREYYLPSMRTRAALSLTRMIMIPALDRTQLFELAGVVSRSIDNPFRSSASKVWQNLALEKSLHQQILNAAIRSSEKIENTRTSSDEKVTALVRLSRLLLPVSRIDAQSLFNRAITVSGEINADAVHELALFEPLASRAKSAMSTEKSRAIASLFSSVVSDAWIRLEGQENFPWSTIARALCTLDVNVALAATARWEDAAIVERSALLPSILETALSRSDLSSRQVAAFLPLLDHVNEHLITAIARVGSRESNIEVPSLTEELAREELLRLGEGRRSLITETLQSINGPNHGPWLRQLVEATEFHRQTGSNKETLAQRDQSYPVRVPQKSNRVGTVNWKEHRFTSAEEINVVFKQLLSPEANEGLTSVSAMLNRMAAEVALGDRVAHLEALTQSESLVITEDDLVSAICERIKEWGTTPSIIDWTRQRLLHFIVEQLPNLSRWIIYGSSSLPTLLNLSAAEDIDKCTAILEGIERHVDSLDGSTVCALVGLAGNYCTASEASDVMEKYSARLIQRIAVRDRDILELCDIPSDATEGVARFLYALLGDVDVRIRWQSAHAIRSLARLSENHTIDKIVDLYPRTSEQSYRRTDAPYYWLASRLWLVIVVDRLTLESPMAVQKHVPKLLLIASDEQFPHVLIREFARSAVYKLVNNGTASLTQSDMDLLELVNIGRVAPRKPLKFRNTIFNKYQDEGRQDRRFKFDTMDTLPNWYSNALDNFADLQKEEFLDVAEKWIVEKWQITNNPWRWDDEPRQDRLTNNSISSHHGDGRLPTAERFHTYLEWHAMWCAIGELIQTRPLADLENDDYRSLKYRISRNSLANPPIWLADLRGSKPLAPRFWFHPAEDIDKWVNAVSDTDFLTELAVDEETIVIDAYHDIRSRNLRCSTQVHSALVSPKTAAALVRALQLVPHYSDYRLPSAGDDFEINVPPYQLKAWLNDVEGHSGIDELDPFRFDVNPIQASPASVLTDVFDLVQHYEQHPVWMSANDKKSVCVYRAWSDTKWDEQNERNLYGDDISSSGYQLTIRKDALKRFLERMKMDLIVEVQITRRNKGYEYSRHDKKDSKESSFDRLLIFRQDGTIEVAEKRLGSWTSLGT